MEATDMEMARATAVAVTIGPGATVLVVGAPLPGLGDALDARGCAVTVLGPLGLRVAEPWANRVGNVDDIQPDPGSLGAFDAVVAPHLLDLAADPATSLRLIVGALGPHGRIVLVASGLVPPDALHRHDAAQVERLCELAGLTVRAVTVVSEGGPVVQADSMAVGESRGPVSARTTADASTVVLVAHRATNPPPLRPCPEEAAGGAATTVAVDRRLRGQQAKILALEEEVRALRATIDHPRRAARALARSLRARIRTRA